MKITLTREGGNMGEELPHEVEFITPDIELKEIVVLPTKTGHFNLRFYRDRGSSRLLTPPTPPYRRVRIRRFSELSPDGPEVRFVVRHKGFAALQVAVSASPSSEPAKLSRS